MSGLPSSLSPVFFLIVGSDLNAAPSLALPSPVHDRDFHLLHVLAVLRRSRWYRWESGKENQQLVDRLVAALGDVSIPVQCYVVHQASLLRRIRRIPASQIHPLPRRRA